MSIRNMLGLGNNVKVSITLDEQERRRTYNHAQLGKLPIYVDMERVGGSIVIAPIKRGKKIEHTGVKVELVGQIETATERYQTCEFTKVTRELELPGEITQETKYNFEFTNAEKLHESYTGINVKLRYFLRVVIERRVSDFVEEKEFWVQSFHKVPVVNNSIKMEVGIEDSLHIEFEYSKSLYHLKDVIVGKIYFLLVRIKIKHMELKLIRRERIGEGATAIHENTTITTFEIMDGAPVRGESIPIRFFIGGHDLQPTMRDVNKKFSVMYLLNLVLVDEGDRRYFKQQEITLWRPKDYTKVSNMSSYEGKDRKKKAISPATSTSSVNKATEAASGAPPAHAETAESKEAAEKEVEAAGN